MTQYNANASVIYTDCHGNRIDTFVIFNTDNTTGLTHINHENLKVPTDKLELHAKTVCQYHLPVNDAFSFELIKLLREKYAEIDSKPKTNTAHVADMHVLKKAS